MNSNLPDIPLNSGNLDVDTKKIAQEILDEKDIDRVKDLTNLFNLNSQKRNVMRVIKMNELLDKVTDQVIERFERKPDNFSNEDLIKYMQVTENAIDKANKQLNLVEETPPIQVMQQNNQVNINIGQELDRESRAKVFDAVRGFLAKAQNTNDLAQFKSKEEDVTDEISNGQEAE